MNSPAETNLITWCNENEMFLEEGLIQNNESITLKEAQRVNKALIFRWRNRMCENCQHSFDITKIGLFYRCVRCQK